MKFIISSISTLCVVALLSFSAHAQNKVVVVPLGGSSTPLEHVALMLKSDVGSVCPNNRSFYLLNSDGVTAPTVYKVPDNKELIVTDVVWEAVPSPTAFTPGRVVTMRLDIYNVTYKGTAFRSAPQLITSEHGTMIGDSEHLTAGVRIGPNNHLCAYALAQNSSGAAVNTVRNSIIYGYYVPRY